MKHLHFGAFHVATEPGGQKRDGKLCAMSRLHQFPSRCPSETLFGSGECRGAGEFMVSGIEKSYYRVMESAYEDRMFISS